MRLSLKDSETLFHGKPLANHSFSPIMKLQSASQLSFFQQLFLRWLFKVALEVILSFPHTFSPSPPCFAQ